MANPDRDEMLAEKNKKSTVRMRQKNRLEQTLLDHKLVCIENEKAKKSGILDKYIRNMQIEVFGVPLDDLEPTALNEPTIDGESGAESRPFSGYSIGLQSDFSMDVPSRPDTHMSGVDMDAELRAALAKTESVHGCRFGAFSGSCKHFPCCIPDTYNSFREFDTGKNISLSARLLEGRIRSSTPVLRPKTESIKSTISSRERALKTMIGEMRLRNEKVRPSDRNVKYGAPMSLRKLYKPARPSFAENL